MVDYQAIKYGVSQLLPILQNHGNHSSPLVINAVLPNTPTVTIPAPNKVALSSVKSFCAIVVIFSETIGKSNLHSYSVFNCLIINDLLYIFFIGTIVIFRTVTIVITIPIAITVSVATTASLGSIQDQGHVLVFFLPVDFLQFSKHTQFKQSCTNHENSTVSQLLDYLRATINLIFIC